MNNTGATAPFASEVSSGLCSSETRQVHTRVVISTRQSPPFRQPGQEPCFQAEGKSHTAPVS